MFDHDHDGELSEIEKIEQDCFYMTEMFDDSENTGSGSIRSYSHPGNTYEGYNKGYDRGQNKAQNEGQNKRQYKGQNEGQNKGQNKGIILAGAFFMILAGGTIEHFPGFALVMIILGIVCFVVK